MSGRDVRAGGAYVEAYVKNDELDVGLAESNRKIRTALSVAKTALVSTGAGVGAAAIAGYGAITTASKGVAAAIGATGSKISAVIKGQKTGIDSTAVALQRLTPVTSRVWALMQGSIGHATRDLASFRQYLVAAGDAARPLLGAFDGIAKKGAGVAWGKRAKSFLLFDRKGIAEANQELKAGRELFLQDRMRGFGGNISKGFGGILKGFTGEGGGWRGLRRDFGSAVPHFGKALGQAGSWINIRGGYAMTAVMKTAASAAGQLLRPVVSLRSGLAGLPLRAAASGISAIGREAMAIVPGLGRATGSVSRLKSAASSLLSGLKSGSGSLGRMSAGILAPLTAMGAFHVGGITQLFTAKGFAQHATEIADRARTNKRSVEFQSALEGASQITGIDVDDKKRAGELRSHMHEAAAAGAVVTADQAREARRATSAIGAMQIALRSVGTAIGSAVLPQIVQGVQWVTRLSQSIAAFVSRNPTLIQQVFTVGKVVGTAAAVMGALSAAVTLATSPIGMATLAVGAASAALAFFGDQTKAILGPVVEVFGEIQADANATFGGIVDALSAGDLNLAAEVAWAGIMSVFRRGWQILDDGWLSFKDATLGVFDSLQTNLRINLDQMFPGFEKAWTETVGFLGDVWTAFVSKFLDLWDAGFKSVAKGINYLTALFSRGFDLKGANEAVEKKFSDRAKQRGLETEKILEARNEARLKRAQDLDKKGTAAVLEEERDKRTKERAAASAQARADDAKALDDAKENLRNATRRAARAREEAGTKTFDFGTERKGAKAGIAELSRRGAEAQDIRTKEGLSLIATAQRGHANNPLVTIANKQTTELKKANDFNLKNWQQLVQLNNNLPMQALPIDGS